MRGDDCTSSFCFASHVTSIIIRLATGIKTTQLNESSDLLSYSTTSNTRITLNKLDKVFSNLEIIGINISQDNSKLFSVGAICNLISNE